MTTSNDVDIENDLLATGNAVALSKCFAQSLERDFDMRTQIFPIVQLLSKDMEEDDVDEDAMFEEFDRMFESEDAICRRIYSLKVQHGNHDIEMALGATRSLPYLDQPAAMHAVLDMHYPV